MLDSLDRHRTVPAPVGARLVPPILEAPEIWKHLGIGPTSGPLLHPALIVQGMAAKEDHAVDRGRAAHDLAAGLQQAPAPESVLRHGCEAPVPRRTRQVVSLGAARNPYAPMGVGSARLQQKNAK